MPKPLLPFHYELAPRRDRLTAKAGLPLFWELIVVSGLYAALAESVRTRSQGYADCEVIRDLVLLQLAGGDCVDDLEHLAGDPGFTAFSAAMEGAGLSRRDRRALHHRFRRERRRAVPSPSSARRCLKGYHDPTIPAQRQAAHDRGVKAFIPTPHAHLGGVARSNGKFLFWVQRQHPVTTATLDVDGTLAETTKREALFCYKGFKAYQPLNVWWFEQGMVLFTEFRDGNVPAGHEQLRVLQEALAHLPPGVTKVYLRSDSAGYQWDLLKYCAEGKNERFGVIEFAVCVDIGDSFKQAVAEVKETDWHPIHREVRRGGRLVQEPTNQEWAEVCYVPKDLCASQKGPEYRFMAIREPLAERTLPGIAQPELPFPTMEFGRKGRHKLFGVVTNRLTMDGEELIHWQRQRCGESEEAHDVMKHDLAGGKLPSNAFGVNAAWWWITMLALNLQAAVKRLLLGGEWIRKRLKALRFALIDVPGQVLCRAGRWIVRLCGDHSGSALLVAARRRLTELAAAGAPSG